MIEYDYNVNDSGDSQLQNRVFDATGYIGMDPKGSIEEVFSYGKSKMKCNTNQLTDKELELQKRLSDQKIGISMFTHDIRSILTSICGYSKLLVEKDGLPEEEKKEMLKILSSSSNRLLDLVISFSDFFKLVDKDGSLTIDEINLSDIINTIIDSNQYLAKNKNINLAYDIGKINVIANNTILSSTLNNLIYNAIKFTNDGGEIKVSATKIGESVEIKVKDSGIGIPDSIKNNLFSLDKKKSSRRGTNKETGIGLGLINSKLGIERGGGKISVDSSEEEGTTFTIKLPLA